MKSKFTLLFSLFVCLCGIALVTKAVRAQQPSPTPVPTIQSSASPYPSPLACEWINPSNVRLLDNPNVPFFDIRVNDATLLTEFGGTPENPNHLENLIAVKVPLLYGESIQAFLKNVQSPDSYREFDMFLFSPSGQQIGGVYDSRFEWKAEEAGTYFIVIRNNTCQPLSFSLTIRDKKKVFLQGAVRRFDGTQIVLNQETDAKNNQIGTDPVEFVLSVPELISAEPALGSPEYILRYKSPELRHGEAIFNHTAKLEVFWRDAPAIYDYQDNVNWRRFLDDATPEQRNQYRVPITVELGRNEFYIHPFGSCCSELSQLFPTHKQYYVRIEDDTNPEQTTWTQYFSTVNSVTVSGSEVCRADITKDGIVDISDYSVLSKNFFAQTNGTCQ